MENIKRTLDLITANINQARENDASGSHDYLLQDLNMAMLLVVQLEKEIITKEVEVEAALQKRFGADVDAMATVHNPAVIA